MNKKYCLWTVLLWAVLLLVSACGDDGTSANSDVLGDSDELTSLSVVSSSGKASHSSVADSVEILPDSSSDKKTASSSSSSSAGNVRRSSSSSKKVASSSSVKIASSSSVLVLDSARLCTPGYMYCSRPIGADSLQAGAYKKFTDSRNGRTYFYLTINGKNRNGDSASVTVMAENLNIGEMVDGSKDQSDDKAIERYCYDNDTTKCEKYGGLYQWAEMMQLPSRCNKESCAELIQPNHQGICPEGWHLLTSDDFYIVVNTNGIDDDYRAMELRAAGYGGLNGSGFSLIGAGLNWVYSFMGLDQYTYWHYPEENSQNLAEWSNAAWQSRYTTETYTDIHAEKINGYSVRCTMNETESAPE
ncbi:FISUMP domain-containing protein [uncultured Fibrobacter sp.]|uniref:FISUMP domain-containing protein n=1 Tax=uncultured Fibrobacter sp. TaxID=261512 RepID=UPI00261CD210|nr:FISUMP domain-containing protein [uncultured Fibrobacter sp.]